MPPRYPVLYLAISIAASFIVAPRPAVADDSMQWQFYESHDPDNKGAMTARLVYGVPETDNVQVMGVCDARPSTGAKFSSVTFGADIGDLANGKETDLRFSGGGFEQTLHGNIQRAEGEGLNGVHLDIKNDDPIWTAFADKDTLDYLVPGYRAATLKLTPGRDKLKAFVKACRTYEKAALGDTAESSSASASDSAEKEDFDNAKELGTVAAFEAFLSNHSSGFFADLAHAYIDKLSKAAASPPAPPPQALAPQAPPLQAPPPPAPTPTAIPGLGPDPSCKDLFKVKSQNSAMPAKITFINKSGMYRSIMWLDFNGRPKDYASLNSGQEVTLDTFLTHPWMVTDGPGNCIEIVMPHAGTRVVTLTGPGGSAIQVPPPPAPNHKPPAPKVTSSCPPGTKPIPETDNCRPIAPPKKKAATPKCRSRSVLINGKCILKRNAGDSCGPGYHLKHGKCVHGAYVTPRSKRSVHGCPPGLDWNPQEGCHEND